MKTLTVEPVRLGGNASRLYRVFLGIGVVLLWIAQWNLAMSLGGVNVDNSWGFALGELFRRRMQGGTDFVFTYGPFGWFGAWTYDAPLFFWRYLWELALKAALTAAYVGAMRHLGGRVRLALSVLAGILVFPVYSNELPYIFFLQSAGVLLLEPMGGRDDLRSAIGGASRTRALVRCGVAALLALIGLVKFTYLLGGVFLMGLVTARALRSRKPGQVLPVLAFFSGTYLILWGLHSGGWSGLPSYFVLSWQTASGYARAMGLEGPSGERTVAMTTLAAFGVALLLAFATAWRPAADQRHSGRGFHVVFLIASLYLQWKHGFVRQDAHTNGFFLAMMLLPFFCPPARARGNAKKKASDSREVDEDVGLCATDFSPSRVQNSFLGLTAALSLAGFLWSSPVRAESKLVDFPLRAARVFTVDVYRYLRPLSYRREMDDWLAFTREQAHLPRIESVVRDRPVDMLRINLAYLFYNGFNWRPRPCFQSYHVYSPALNRANARFLSGPDAPDFLLYDHRTVDCRYPNLDDGIAFLEAIRRYEWVLEEKGLLLFKRRKEPPARTGAVAGDSAASLPDPSSVELVFRPGQWVELPEEMSPSLFISFPIAYTTRGAVRTFLLRSAPFLIEVQTSTGLRETFSLIPGATDTGFLLSPLLFTTGDVRKWLEGKPGHRVLRARLLTDDDWEAHFVWPIIAKVQSVVP